MKNYLGMGTGATLEAVRQAVQGIGHPTAILFMTGYDQLEETAQLIREKFPDIPSIGTLGTKIVNGQVSDKSIAVMGLYDDAVVQCGLVEEISACPILAIPDLQKAIQEVHPGKSDTVLIEYCTNDEEKLVTTFQSCLEKSHIQLAGGTVFGAPEGKPTMVAYNGNVYTNACVYALIKNTTGAVKVFKENIYKQKIQKHHFATKVDTARKALIELDGRPAADVYCEEVGVPKNKIIDNVLKNPMGRVVGNEVYISSMHTLEANGTLLNYKRINKNDCIYFLELGDYRAIEKETQEEISHCMRKISFVISIDCIYRYLLYEGKGYFSDYAKDMAKLGNHLGIVGGGEQYNNQHVNQTMVCAVFE